MTITVTAEDIAQGSKACHSCPVARAMIRSGYANARVGRNIATWGPWPGSHHVMGSRAWHFLPVEVANFVDTFDKPGGREQVTPFSFEMIEP